MRQRTAALRERGRLAALFHTIVPQARRSASGTPAAGLAGARSAQRTDLVAIRAGRGGGARHPAGDGQPSRVRPAGDHERQGGGDGTGLLSDGGRLPVGDDQSPGAGGGGAAARSGPGGDLPGQGGAGARPDRVRQAQPRARPEQGREAAPDGVHRPRAQTDQGRRQDGQDGQDGEHDDHRHGQGGHGAAGGEGHEGADDDWVRRRVGGAGPARQAVLPPGPRPLLRCPFTGWAPVTPP